MLIFNLALLSFLPTLKLLGDIAWSMDFSLVSSAPTSPLVVCSYPCAKPFYMALDQVSQEHNLFTQHLSIMVINICR